MNEYTPFQGTAFLSDDYKEEQLSVQPRPFSSEVSNVLEPSARYVQQANANRLRGSVAKSSKLQALISMQAGSSLAISGETSLKLSALSMRAGKVGLTAERQRYDKEKIAKEKEKVKAKEKERKEKGRREREKERKRREEEKKAAEVEEEEILQILQPSVLHQSGKGKAEMKEVKKEEEEATRDGKQRLSALAKTLKLKRAMAGQAEIQEKGELLKDSKKLKAKLQEFYASVNVKKTDDFLENAVGHIREHGFAAFQEKLVQKYGKGLEFSAGLDNEDDEEDEEAGVQKGREMKSLTPGPFSSLGIFDVNPAKLRERIVGFYEHIRDPKEPSFIDAVMQQIEHNGVEKFNEGLKEKYGVDLDSSEEELEKARKEMPEKPKPRGNIFSSMLSMRFGSTPVPTGGQARESMESIEEPKKAPRRAIFSNVLGIGGSGDKKAEARKPGRIAAVFGNLINFRPGRRSIAFTGKTK